MAKEAQKKNHGFTEAQEKDHQKNDMVNMVKCHRVLIQTCKCPLDLAIWIGISVRVTSVE